MGKTKWLRTQKIDWGQHHAAPMQLKAVLLWARANSLRQYWSVDWISISISQYSKSDNWNPNRQHRGMAVELFCVLSWSWVLSLLSSASTYSTVAGMFHHIRLDLWPFLLVACKSRRPVNPKLLCESNRCEMERKKMQRKVEVSLLMIAIPSRGFALARLEHAGTFLFFSPHV